MYVCVPAKYPEYKPSWPPEPIGHKWKASRNSPQLPRPPPGLGSHQKQSSMSPWAGGGPRLARGWGGSGSSQETRYGPGNDRHTHTHSPSEILSRLALLPLCYKLVLSCPVEIFTRLNAPESPGHEPPPVLLKQQPLAWPCLIRGPVTLTSSFTTAASLGPAMLI